MGRGGSRTCERGRDADATDADEEEEEEVADEVRDGGRSGFDDDADRDVSVGGVDVSADVEVEEAEIGVDASVDVAVEEAEIGMGSAEGDRDGKDEESAPPTRESDRDVDVEGVRMMT